MQTFENLLLQNYSTDITYKFLDIGATTLAKNSQRQFQLGYVSLGMCNQSLFKWWRHLHFLQNNSKRRFEYNTFNANL